jgi:hydroxymethylpyrimidine/phosphomethylpyrimidine kinase
MTSAKKIVLTIAGSDPSGGAGAQADLRVFSDMGVKAVSAITAITAQDDDAVLAIHPTRADILTQQMSTACKGGWVPDAIKIGMVATQANVRAIIWFLGHTESPHVVIDPVLHSSTGTPLIEAKALAMYRQQLIPLATVLTPNLMEAQVLAGMQVNSIETMTIASQTIYQETVKLRGGGDRPLAVVVKGGHLEGDPVDVLFDGKSVRTFEAKRIVGPSPRGTGCRFSSAIAARLALGDEIGAAVAAAKEYLGNYISRKH